MLQRRYSRWHEHTPLHHVRGARLRSRGTRGAFRTRFCVHARYLHRIMCARTSRCNPDVRTVETSKTTARRELVDIKPCGIIPECNTHTHTHTSHSPVETPPLYSEDPSTVQWRTTCGLNKSLDYSSFNSWDITPACFNFHSYLVYI